MGTSGRRLFQKKGFLKKHWGEETEPVSVTRAEWGTGVVQEMEVGEQAVPDYVAAH